MFKKFLLLLVLFPVFVHAQVSIHVQLPPSGMIQKDQLWNLVLVNNSTTSFDATVIITLQDLTTGQTILSGSSRSITLAKGIRTVNVQEVQPIQYNYITSFNGSFLPFGTYLICYSLTKRSSDEIQTLASECVTIIISPLSPPLLNSPADKAVLQTAYPLFSWIPPTPLQMFDDLNYELTVVQVQPGQSSLEAIRYNTPVFIKTGTKQNFEAYPTSHAKLDTNKNYAWQVIAKNGFSYSAITEVWTFSLLSDTVKVTSTESNYILLQSNRNEAGLYYLQEGKLFIKYYSFDKDHETIVRFYDNKGSIVNQKKQKITYGDNFIKFELSRHFKEGEVYRIEITDLQTRQHTANFSINKSTNK